MNEKPDRAGIIAPPPLLLVLCLAAGFVAEHFQQLPLFAVVYPSLRPLGPGLFAVAAITLFAAIRELLSHKTNLNPYKATSVIVVRGVYNFTRNPIYVAFLLIVVACALAANSAWLILSALVLFVFLHFGVVKREEQYLSAKFGSTYEDYRRRVRRWI